MSPSTNTHLGRFLACSSPDTNKDSHIRMSFSSSKLHKISATLDIQEPLIREDHTRAVEGDLDIFCIVSTLWTLLRIASPRDHLHFSAVT